MVSNTRLHLGPLTSQRRHSWSVPSRTSIANCVGRRGTEEATAAEARARPSRRELAPATPGSTRTRPSTSGKCACMLYPSRLSIRRVRRPAKPAARGRGVERWVMVREAPRYPTVIEALRRLPPVRRSAPLGGGFSPPVPHSLENCARHASPRGCGTRRTRGYEGSAKWAGSIRRDLPTRLALAAGLHTRLSGSCHGSSLRSSRVPTGQMEETGGGPFTLHQDAPPTSRPGHPEVVSAELCPRTLRLRPSGMCQSKGQHLYTPHGNVVAGGGARARKHGSPRYSFRSPRNEITRMIH